jgi:hypothetical protein
MLFAGNDLETEQGARRGKCDNDRVEHIAGADRSSTPAAVVGGRDVRPSVDLHSATTEF